ncbi:hypothetical protein PDL71_08070 [Lacibacter sp. MH-610]|uniref:hypothetical protein n=1 Tax=Lacibacter sp. MH-610 TaxID=3020883 RepID=UPI003892243C
MPETAEHKHVADDLLLKVSQATSGYVGHDYLQELTKFITFTLGVRYALISECANESKTKVRTISYVDRGEPLENIEYDLAGTPCEIVMNGEDYFVPKTWSRNFQKKSILNHMFQFPSTAHLPAK